DEQEGVQILLREIASRVDGTARARRVTPVKIHLPDFVRERIKALAIGDGFEPARRPAIDRLVVSIRNRHIHAGISVCRRSEDGGVFSEAEAPRVVVARTNKLQRRAIGLEAKDALPEADFFPANVATKSGVPNRSPNPVIETIAQVAGRSGCVAHAPPGAEHPALASLVVAVQILE